MTSSNPEELEDSFEIEISRMPGVGFSALDGLWRARQFGVFASSGQRRRRFSGVAALVAVCCLVLINCLDLSGLVSGGVPLVGDAFTGGGLTARASGYTWLALRARPLRLPPVAPGGVCPVTPPTQQIVDLHSVRGIGTSATFVSAQNTNAAGVVQAFRSRFFHLASSYQGVIVTWYIRLPNAEPVYIRGAQLDGSNILRFDGGIGQPNFTNNPLGGRTVPELMLSSSSDHGTPVATWSSITRIPASGCYAYQIDTPMSSTVLVFQAQTEP